MEDYKQYLSEDANDRERETAKQVLDGLAGLKLENKVAEVAAERRAWLRRRFWVRFMASATLVMIAGVAFLFFWKNEDDQAPKPEQPALQQPIATENQSNGPAKDPEENKEKGPIAQNQTPERLPSPRFPSPNVRGENKEDKAWKALLDQVWYTEYPIIDLGVSETFGKADQSLRSRDFNTAFVQLQRVERKLAENDTLRFLKGYCLMEMGEGSEALTYFDKIAGKQPGWQPSLEWYRGLALLLKGDKQAAGSVFGKIAVSPSHPYRKQAERARQLLK